MKTHLRSWTIGAAFLALAASSAIHEARAAAFTAGDLVVYRVGNGTETLSNTGNSVFLDEYTPTGTLVQSIAVDNSNSGGALIASGTATSEGLLNYNNGFLTLTGYNQAVGGTTSLSGTTGTTVNRIVDVYGQSGSLLSSTKLTDFASGNNPRSGVTADGTNLFVGGGAGGVRSTTVGSTTSTQINTTANVRDVAIFGGTTYFSTGSGTTGIYSASGGTQTMIAASTSPYQFAFAALGGTMLNTLYVANDTANAIQKFSLVGSTWTATGSITATAVRGLTLSVDTSGNVNLFGSTGGGTGGGSLYSFTDTTGYNGTASGTVNTFATLSSTSNESFRGIAYVAAVPEPTTLLGGALLLGATIWTQRRRLGGLLGQPPAVA